MVRQLVTQADELETATIQDLPDSAFLLLLLLIGVVDIGRAFQSYITITNAAREGARTAARIPQSESADGFIRAAVQAEAANGNVDLTDTSVSRIVIEPARETRTAGSPITVRVEYTVESVVGRADKLLYRSKAAGANRVTVG